MLVNVSIKQWKYLSLSVDVNPEDTVGELKRTIYRQCKQENISGFDGDDYWGIYFKDLEMEVNKTLSHYNINEGTTVQLVREHVTLWPSSECLLCVMMPSGDDVRLAVSSKRTVLEVKSMIEEERGIPIPSQRLFKRYREMEDSKTLRNNFIFGEQFILLETAEKATDSLQSNKVLVNLEIPGLKCLLRYSVDPQVTVGEFISTLNSEKNKKFLDTVEWACKKQVKMYNFLRAQYHGISFKDVEMENEKTLSHYNIHEGATLQLVREHITPCPSSECLLYVMMPSGDDVRLAVSLKRTVLEVKSMIEEERGIPIPSQRLFAQKEEMEDSKMVSDYGIIWGTFILLKSSQKATDSLLSNKVWVNVEIRGLKGLLRYHVDPQVKVSEFIRTVNAEKNRQILGVIYRQEIQQNPYHFLNTIYGQPCMNDEKMETYKTLSHYKIYEGATLKMMSECFPCSAGGYFLHVLMPSGDDLRLAVQSKNKVSEVKSMIEEEKKIPIGSQRLLVRDEEMKDSKTLLDYGINREGVILLQIAEESKTSVNTLIKFVKSFFA